MAVSSKSSQALRARYAAFVVAICAIIVCFSVWHELASRELDLKNAESELANLANSLTQHADDTFDLANTMLVNLEDRLETDGTSVVSITKTQAFLRNQRPNLSRIKGLFVYDETGRWLATTESVDFAGLNNSDRSYFQQHRENPDLGTVVGNPVQSRSGGQWIITVSRRFNKMDGSFGGVVLATVDVAYFSQYYAAFNVGPRGAISLLSRSGILLARSSESSKYIGRDVSRSAMFDDPTTRSAGTYQFASLLDGEQRVSFFKFSSRYPFAVIATRAQRDVLAEWRRTAGFRLLATLCIVIVIAVSGYYLGREVIARQRMASALRSREAIFRLMAEESSDVVMRIDFDGTILYASPACMRIVGWTQNELMGTSALAGIHLEDRPRIENSVASLRRGEIHETKVDYRTNHKSRGMIWLETALRATRDQTTGRVDGVVAISRDMTLHKQLERRLADLAATDPLTGLANRRCFDQCLADEWSRARREGKPLSLLLLDIDHFKAFNDRYGHQGGDECLRKVAELLKSHARRPGDLAARYGGEEFVLLLPQTDSAGCREVGERVREGLWSLAIPHEASSTNSVVTASFGGTTAWPGLSNSSVPDFVEAADRALYRAKECGRNGVYMSGEIIDLARQNGRKSSKS